MRITKVRVVNIYYQNIKTVISDRNFREKATFMALRKHIKRNSQIL